MGREIGPGDGMGNGMNVVGAARASIWSNGVSDQLGLNQRGACVSIFQYYVAKLAIQSRACPSTLRQRVHEQLYLSAGLTQRMPEKVDVSCTVVVAGVAYGEHSLRQS